MEQGSAVLVVDDEPGVRQTAVDMFEALGHVVFQAWNAEAAILMLRSHPEIRLLFSDIRMPGMSGAGLAVEAQKIRPDLKIVLTSGHAPDASGANVTFLRKPWRLADMEAALQGKPPPKP